MIGTLNEEHLGTAGLKMLQQLIAVRPKYDKGILTLRRLMLQKGLKLVSNPKEPRELVEIFNSNMDEKGFSAYLHETRKKAPKAVEYLLRLIKRQEFQN